MELGIKFNLKSAEEPPPFEWLTLPNFRMGQQSAQDFAARAAGLKAKGFKLHGHPLIDLRKHPKVEYAAELDYYLLGLTESFTGLVDSWDVTNECANYDRWGDYWQAKAFEAMRELAPGSKLYMNEYAIQDEQYWGRALKLAERLKKDGLLDGVGIQCRADIRNNSRFAAGMWALLKRPISEARLSSVVREIKTLDLLCHFSEVECFHDKTSESGQRAANILEGYLSIAEKLNVDRFTYWS